MKRLIVGMLMCLVLVSSHESKGDDYMKVGEYSAYFKDGELAVRFPIEWEEDGSDVKIWMDLAGKVPKTPSVMPYDSRHRARAKLSTFFTAIFDGAQLVAGKTYDLHVKVEYLANNGSTRVASDRLTIIIPKPDESFRVDRFGRVKPEKQPPQGSTDRSNLGRSAGPIGPPDLTMKGKDFVRVKTVKTAGGTEYNYTVRAQDDIINSFMLEIQAPVQVTGTPQGWLVIPQRNLPSDHPAGIIPPISWMTKDSAIQPRKQLNFTVVGSDKRTNVPFFVQGSGKVTSGLIEGPGN
jgi:hypothetical protein